MLILTRKIGEQITIGESIQVTVVAIRDNRVRIGLAAPRQVSIQRDDIASEPVELVGPRRIANARQAANARSSGERKTHRLPRAG